MTIQSRVTSGPWVSTLLDAKMGTMITAPTAPRWYASVKMSQNCDACVELASHEMSAIQGVVAARRLLDSHKETD